MAELDELQFKQLMDAYLANNAKKVSQAREVTSTENVYLQGYNRSGSVRIKASLLETTVVAKNIVGITTTSLEVAYGTVRANVPLPTTVTVIYSNNTTESRPVTWDNATPTYNGNTSRDYIFNGNITLAPATTNTGNLLAKATITVTEQLSAKQTYINLHTPTVGNNMLRDTTFRQSWDNGNLGNGWRADLGASLMVREDGTIKVSTHAGLKMSLAQNIPATTEVLKIGVWVKGTNISSATEVKPYSLYAAENATPILPIAGTFDWTYYETTFESAHKLPSQEGVTVSLLIRYLDNGGLLEFREPRVSVVADADSHSFNNLNELKLEAAIKFGETLDLVSYEDFDVDVPYNTSFTALDNVFTGIYTGGVAVRTKVTWQATTPAYNRTVAGEYLGKGILEMLLGMSNTLDIRPNLTLTVLALDDGSLTIASVEPTIIELPYGAPAMSIRLPATRLVTLSDGSKSQQAITWGASAPAYVGTTARDYTFTGDIALPTGAVNTYNIKAITTVTLKARASSGTPIAPTMTPSALPAQLSSINATFYKDIPYKSGGRQKLDIFMPNASTTPTAVVMHMHGGYFITGYKDEIYSYDASNPTWNGPAIIANCIANNIAFISSSYTTVLPANDTEGLKKPLGDSTYCLQYIKYFAKIFNIDKAKVLPIGSSAGGTTSMYLGFSEDFIEPSNIDFVKRESTSVVGMGVYVGQGSLDIVKYENVIFKNTGFNLLTYVATVDPEMEPVARSYFALEQSDDFYGQKATQYADDIDFFGKMSAGAPELYISNPNYDISTLPTSRDELVHSSQHAYALKRETDSLGIPNVCWWKDHSDPRNETIDDFILRKLVGGTREQLTIATVTSLGSRTVSPMIELEGLLQEHVEVTYTNGKTDVIFVAWTSTPIYNAAVAGTYVFSGNLLLPQGVTNPLELKGSATVVIDGTVSEKQTYIYENTPNVGRNLLADSKFRMTDNDGIGGWRVPIGQSLIKRLGGTAKITTNPTLRIDLIQDVAPSTEVFTLGVWVKGTDLSSTLPMTFFHTYGAVNVSTLPVLTDGTFDWEYHEITFESGNKLPHQAGATVYLRINKYTSGTIEFKEPRLYKASEYIESHSFKSMDEVKLEAAILYEEPLTLISIADVALEVPLNISYNTLNNVFDAVYEDDIVLPIKVIWGASTPPHEKNTPGVYEAEGTLVMLEGTINPSAIKANLTLTIVG